MRTRWLIVFVAAALVAPDVAAQSLGTFRWQLQPYCNVITVTVVPSGGVYRLEGTDDQCGAAGGAASAIGTAFLTPSGVGIGLNIVAAPGGVAMPVSAALSLSTLNGTWSDGSGNSGTFAFTPGAGTGGSPRPTAVQGLLAGGAFLAAGSLGAGAIPASGSGVRMMWYPGKAAFRAGRVAGTRWDDDVVGNFSTAFGINTTASGPASTALGDSSVASGSSSLAAGFGTTASAQASVALGTVTSATGINSLAQGQSSIASGSGSVALGSSEASGRNAVSFGNGSQAIGVASVAGGGAIARGEASLAFGRAETTGTGAFAWGDFSSPVLVAAAIGQWRVRATGGVTFYSDSAMTSGVQLAVNGTQWSSLSDVHSKHAFRDLDGEEVLARLAKMPVREWSYKAQDASIRHIGPTAQDFHAAFGLGEDPLRIGTLDADGVALAAVRALEQRTRALQQENEALREALAEIRRIVTALTPR